MTAERAPSGRPPAGAADPEAGAPGGGLRAPDLETEWARAIKALDGAAEICLACHIRPDGDALGSMLAVAQALRARGAGERPPGSAPPRIVASFGELPLRIPRILRFLPGTELLSPPDAVPDRPQVMVTFDAASADRLGMLEAAAARAEELIVLDHHASNTSFGTVNLIDPAAAATAVLAYELIGRLGVPVTRDIALGLYAGLVTDTGSFRYSNTSPRGAPARGPAARDRHRPGRGRARALGPRPVRLPGAALGGARPGAARAGLPRTASGWSGPR